MGGPKSVHFKILIIFTYAMGTGILPVLPFPSSVQSSSPMPPPLSQAFPLTSVPYPHAKGLTPWTLPLGFWHKERSPLGRLQVRRLGDVGKLPSCLIAILGKMLGSNGLPPNLQYWQCPPSLRNDGFMHGTALLIQKGEPKPFLVVDHNILYRPAPPFNEGN